MSVLIKGMDMPQSCADCDLHNPFLKTPYCRRLLQAIPIEGRLENCPLVEVPTPHGRLIDTDVLCERLMDVWDMADKKGKMFISAVISEIVAGMPTVIGAEE